MAILDDLAGHVEQRHHGFLVRQFLRLERLLPRVEAAHWPRHGAMLAQLWDTFDALKQLVQSHLAKEEQILFPTIRRIEAAGTRAVGEVRAPALARMLRELRSEHEAIRSMLRQWRQITHGYRLPTNACGAFRALYDGLRAVELDLNEHLGLEEDVLFPRAAGLQRAARAAGVAPAERSVAG
jgi:regulator of cell morphogenesis and NO signaling